MKDIFILQIETATSVCSVAISKSGETVAVIESAEPNIHASYLTLFINQALVKAGISMSQLDAVAVSMGPGSYTGLRIGVSTAKGVCYGLGLPLVAVDTLDAMACGFSKAVEVKADQILVPMIDARRMEVYTAQYTSKLRRLDETKARIIDGDSFAPDQSNFVLFGTGADKFIDLFSATPNVAVTTQFYNSAAHLSDLAFKRFQTEQFEDIIYFEPFYLKDFIASTPKSR
ncbi:MAG: tRNA (adenosine(37)-N6)-threonylcarbamoyltransferase complex dimerization subunit type 1 TsaB [Sphingobacterium sp.]|uniref:tRNA (adenosine(37)-N6)-threonylcarbamoyltransferase complex dimerization subunit type 1 TsaB n=1 Tax=Sphingobacterium sp. JB170 TaxID=1434842 RepID=UPI00097E965F|nr:tRNA (adenosine(37)-N6)-threonylcarbamoyltransferase complex dimerization subunit type 1 TsaB [Sphingobacterium sp. JB170]SJN30776.1 TsaB protein, required for threonylcarbamoyladenosine (t(6)A) formation in tRNA [Sphingobacterium sp. JB170]